MYVEKGARERGREGEEEEEEEDGLPRKFAAEMKANGYPSLPKCTIDCHWYSLASLLSTNLNSFPHLEVMKTGWLNPCPSPTPTPKVLSQEVSMSMASHASAAMHNIAIL